MSRAGKDGSVFNLGRWVNWAASATTGMSGGLQSGNMEGARRNGAKTFRRKGGPRRECAKCSRMIHVACKACPGCGAAA